MPSERRDWQPATPRNQRRRSRGWPRMDPSARRRREEVPSLLDCKGAEACVIHQSSLTWMDPVVVGGMCVCVYVCVCLCICVCVCVVHGTREGRGTRNLCMSSTQNSLKHLPVRILPLCRRIRRRQPLLFDNGVHVGCLPQRILWVQDPGPSSRGSICGSRRVRPPETPPLTPASDSDRLQGMQSLPAATASTKSRNQRPYRTVSTSWTPCINTDPADDLACG